MFEIPGYVVLAKLGEGSYGQVYLCGTGYADGSKVAVKVMLCEGTVLSASQLREGVTLVALRHDHIVQVLDVVSVRSASLSNRSIYIGVVMEYVRGGGLDNHVRPELGANMVRTWMSQLLRAVSFMHHNNFVHRDIKPGNILVDARGMLKVADFGLTRKCDPRIIAQSADVVTLNYRAPELLLGAPRYSTSVDVWSVGCVFYELLLGKPLFMPKNHSVRDMIREIVSVMGPPPRELVRGWPGSAVLKDHVPRRPVWFPAHVHPEAIDLFRRMTQYDPLSRVGADQALLHRYFKT